MADRKPIPKRTRFEVFKRDKFTCQYCGRSAPDVVLHVDHIEPVAEGGTNDIMNLVTACSDCNLGKGARRLSDDAAINAKKKQLDELADRREQIEMMYEWQMSLVGELPRQVDAIESVIYELTGFELYEQGRSDIRALIADFGFGVVIDATRIAFTKYPHETDSEWGFAFGKIGGICFNKTHKSCGQCIHKVGYDRDSKLYECEYDDYGGKWCRQSFAEKCKRYKSRYEG